MGLRPGDIDEKIDGKMIWIIGRSGSGKSSLICALQTARPGIISLDDHLRVRAGIHGAGLEAYDKMIGLSFALARQGFDILLPCGAQTRELRDYIRRQMPSIRFVYLSERGRYCSDFEEPQADEDILIIPAAATTPEEVSMVTEDQWKTEALITGC